MQIIKWLLVLALFAPLLYFAFREKKWYLYLACGLIGVLPDEFAIEVSSKLPLLTGSRVLVLILLVFWFIKIIKTRKLQFPISIAVYLGLNIVISLINLRFGMSGEIKRVAIFVLERFLLISSLVALIDSREELEKCLDAMLLGCAALCVMGFCQTILKFDIASVLDLVVARVRDTITPRMGMTRAFGTSNAISFGCYCAFMSVLAYYRLEKTGKHRYSLLLSLITVALICTLSRSAWLCFAFVVFCLMVMRPLRFFKRIWFSACVTLAVCLSLCFIVPTFYPATANTTRSCANTVLALVDIKIPEVGMFVEPTEPSRPEDETIEFGLNQHTAAESRLVEWSSVTYMMQEGEALFGYGYNAFVRGKLHYLYPQFGFWTVAETLDVGLLAIVADSGIVGLAIYSLLMLMLCYLSLRRMSRLGTFNFFKCVSIMLPMYLLINFMAALNGPIWLFLGLVYASLTLDKKGIKDDGTPAPYNKWVF